MDAPACHSWRVPDRSVLAPVAPEDWFIDQVFLDGYWPKKAAPCLWTAMGALAQWQAGRCAICGARPPVLVKDHCHDTGLVRGFLCGSCNSSEHLSSSFNMSKRVQRLYREIPPTKQLRLRIRYGSVR